MGKLATLLSPCRRIIARAMCALLLLCLGSNINATGQTTQPAIADINFDDLWELTEPATHSLSDQDPLLTPSKQSLPSALSLPAKQSVPRVPSLTRAPSMPSNPSRPNESPDSIGLFDFGIDDIGLSPAAKEGVGSVIATQDSSTSSSVQASPVGHQTDQSSTQDCQSSLDCQGFGCQQPGCRRCRGGRRLIPEYWGLQVGGWVELGWVEGGILGSSPGQTNSPVLFNDRADEFLLNQTYVFVEHAARTDGSRWDVGGRFDLTYGTDSRFIAASGLENHRDDTPKWNSENDRYGIALPQVYVEFAAPVSHGLSVKVGHFYSIAGVESVAAPCNFFYSHSYALLYGQPFTNTGALATYRPSDRVTMQLGYAQGWDVWSSLADTYSVMARLAVSSRSKRTSLAATVYSGSDVTGVRADVPLDADRHLVDIVFAHRLSDRLNYVIQTDFGVQEDGEINVMPGPSAISFDSAKWGGIASYFFYTLNERWESALRLEWFDDNNQSRLGIPVVFNPGGPVLQGGNYFAVTGGLNYTPNCNIVFRPEVRWDWSDMKGNDNVPGGNASIRAFDSTTGADSQFTVGADLIVFF